jgi:hypothetical protein
MNDMKIICRRLSTPVPPSDSVVWAKQLQVVKARRDVECCLSSMVHPDNAVWVEFQCLGILRKRCSPELWLQPHVEQLSSCLENNKYFMSIAYGSELKTHIDKKHSRYQYN